MRDQGTNTEFFFEKHFSTLISHYTAINKKLLPIMYNFQQLSLKTFFDPTTFLLLSVLGGIYSCAAKGHLKCFTAPPPLLGSISLQNNRLGVSLFLEAISLKKIRISINFGGYFFTNSTSRRNIEDTF